MKNNDKPKTIAVLLDLEGTSDFIDDEKAKLFVEYLDCIRKQIGADFGTISISTHYHDSSVMRNVLEVLGRNTTNNIKIGLNFYYGGIFDFYNKCDIPQGYSFNRDKIATFEHFYFWDDNIENLWFALIDDMIPEDTFTKYQKKHPMFLCRPSQKSCGLKYNCFMHHSTMTKGFDGVLESFDKYINLIDGLSIDQILEKQKNMLVHLAGYDFSAKIRNGEYNYLYRYFNEGFADENDYVDFLQWIFILLPKLDLTKAELVELNSILDLVNKQFVKNNDEQNKEKLKKLQLALEKNS